ncbi:MAG: hypothetical protein HKP61_18680 [Dactylosporangium sp.]|nr:hypothetical protein [Dactylosporangium sp.]NNJ62914.1 hypothetical protein [Dactylosporangium sp.]
MTSVPPPRDPAPSWRLGLVTLAGLAFLNLAMETTNAIVLRSIAAAPHARFDGNPLGLVSVGSATIGLVFAIGLMALVVARGSRWTAPRAAAWTVGTLYLLYALIGGYSVGTADSCSESPAMTKAWWTSYGNSVCPFPDWYAPTRVAAIIASALVVSTAIALLSRGARGWPGGDRRG